MASAKYFIFIFFAIIGSLASAQTSLERHIQSEQLRYQNTVLNKKSLLSESYNVVYQRLELNISMSQRWLKGKITTSFKPLKPAFNILQFDLENYLKVDSVTYNKKKLSFTHLEKVLTIQLSKSLAIGSLDSVSVYYQGDPGTNNPYQSYVYDLHNSKDPKPIVYTLSEPYGAKGWWPCKESLSDKIDSLDVVLTIEKGNKAASNGLLIVEKQLNDSQMLFHWRHRYPIATYLVGIAVTNYVAYEEYVVYPGNDTLPILNYVYPEYEAEAKTKSFETGKMIKLFDKLFGNYPFKKEKYGHAQWNWGGGMEHQTMSFMANFDFDLVAHELAHQWFGDWATCGSWQDLWLNEGFATYLNALSVQYILGQSDFEYRMNDTRQDIVREPWGSVFVSDTNKRDRLFSSRLTYSKGAFLLHMLRWKLGDDAFFAGVRNYLNKPGISYGFGTTTDLKRELEKSSGQNLTEFFKDWFYGEGHPIYNIQWSHIGNHFSVQIKQSTSHPSVSFFNMPLPFKIYGNNKDTSLIFDPISKDNTFTVDLNFVPQKVVFDPNIWILCKSNLVKVNSPNAPAIQIFPNPAGNKISIYTNSGKIEIISIFDLSGRSVYSKNFKAENNLRESQDADIERLSPGLYIVKITTETGTAMQRIIKS